MITMFFKNLCECNFIKFKTLLGEMPTNILDDGWNRYKTKSFTSVISMSFTHIMKTTKLGENRDSLLIRSDFFTRIKEILQPLLQLINETIIGPCKINQDIFIDSDISGLTNIAVRLIDEMSSSNSDEDIDIGYYEMAKLAVSVLTGLTEGHNEAYLERVAIKMPATIIVDRIHRLMKKLYVQELIRAGDWNGLNQAD